MQVLISSGVPAAALLTKSASASSGRAIDTMSAWPEASTASATSGVLMRLVATRGMESPCPFNFCVTHANPARGTDVAIVGTRAYELSHEPTVN